VASKIGLPTLHVLSTTRGKPNSEAREARTPNLLIWSQTRYCCAIAPLTFKVKQELGVRDTEVRLLLVQTAPLPQEPAHRRRLDLASSLRAPGPAPPCAREPNDGGTAQRGCGGLPVRAKLAAGAMSLPARRGPQQTRPTEPGAPRRRGGIQAGRRTAPVRSGVCHFGWASKDQFTQ
jgi:hypothetical protein